MKKLSKDLLAERDALTERIRNRRSDLESAVDEFNSKLEELFAAIETAQSDYNEVVQDANAWRESAAQEIQEYMDERSEKWLESDRGQLYESWKAEYEDGDLEEIELECPEPFTLDDCELIDETIDGYAEAPE